MLYKAIFSEDFLSYFRLDDNGKTLVLTDKRGFTRAVRLIEESNVVSTEDKALIEKLEQLEALMIPSCFKVDMEAVKGQMLELLDKMTLNTMKQADVVAVLEIFLAYLRGEEKAQGKWKLVEKNNQDIDIVCPVCNNIRFPEYSHGYTIEEVEEYLTRHPLPYFCEDCGVDMRQEEQK